MAINLNDNSNNQNNNNSNNTGTGYTNVNSYLNANKNNQLASTVQKGVQGVTDKTQQQTQQANDQFNNSLGNAVQDIKAGNNIQNTLNGQDFSNDQNAQASQNALNNLSGIDPSSGRSYADETAAIYKGYTGPQSLQNSDQLQSQAQDLTQLGRSLNNNNGRQAALQRFVNAGPSYTANKQQFDNLLLGQNTQALNDVKRNALTQAGTTTQAVNNAQNSANAYSQQYNTLAPQLQNTFGTLTNSLTNNLNTRANDATTKATNDVAQLTADLRNHNLNQGEYNYIKNALGGADIGTLSENDLESLIQSQPAGYYNASSMATPEQYAAAQTLAKLSGGQSSVALDPSQLGKAKNGTFGDETTTNSAIINQLEHNRSDLAGAGTTFNVASPFNTGSSYFQPTLNYSQAGQIMTPNVVALLNNPNAINDASSPIYKAAVADLQNAQSQGLLAKSLNLNGTTDYNGNPIFQNDLQQSLLIPGLQSLRDSYNGVTNDINTKYGVGNTLDSYLGKTTNNQNIGGTIPGVTTNLGPAINPRAKALANFYKNGGSST